MKWVPSVLSAFLITLLLLVSNALPQPINDQEWNLNATIASDTITIDCSEFLLPFDVGSILEELDPVNSDQGEFSQSMRAAHIMKITLQPQSGTSDNLSAINGCSIDGTLVLLAPNDAGDTITVTSIGNIDLPGGISVVLDSPDSLMLLIRRGSTYRVIGGIGDVEVIGGGATNEFTAPCTTPVLLGTSLPINQGTDTYLKLCIDESDNTPLVQGVCSGGSCQPRLTIPVDQSLCILDEEGGECLLDIDPDAPTPNERYQFGSGREPLVSSEVVLRPSGNCTVAEEAIVTNAPIEDWITCADTTGDAVSFSYKVVGKIDTDSAVKITMHAVNKNAAPTGTFTLACAAQAVQAGIGAYAAHSTTGQQNVSFTTFDTQNRLEIATATFTLNGTLGVNAHVMGQCNVTAAPAQIANIRLHGAAMIELFANSLSD